MHLFLRLKYIFHSYKYENILLLFCLDIGFDKCELMIMIFYINYIYNRCKM